MNEPLVITIDGPAGAGKSTVAQKLAARLGLMYVDSGATYRAAALKVLEAGIDPLDEPAVAKLIGATDVQVTTGEGEPRVLVDGDDVTARLRTPEVTLAAAQVSRLPEVRAKLIEMQRAFARGRGVVMEGRDIGTVVFPQAKLKIFLKANVEERARRRLKQDSSEGAWQNSRRPPTKSAAATSSMRSGKFRPSCLPLTPWTSIRQISSPTKWWNGFSPSPAIAN